MAKIFLDTNTYIDLIEARKTGSVTASELEGHSLFISPLSTHILCYIYKHQIPADSIIKIQKIFEVVDFTNDILDDSLMGPTNDLEDNIQLHSAANSECKYFLTGDKSLLEIKYFGKVRIISSLYGINAG